MKEARVQECAFISLPQHDNFSSFDKGLDIPRSQKRNNYIPGALHVLAGNRLFPPGHIALLVLNF